ncbi:calcium/sodium antiporter [Candidatus Omnitrophota bacterium]
MGIYAAILIFIIGIAVIIKSADLFTDGAEGIAAVFRIPRIIIGLTIVSVATTFPEFIVSTVSSYMGFGGMAVGNALGSCLANIGLILAAAAMIRTITFPANTLKRELPFLLSTVAVFYALSLNGRVSSSGGILLLVMLAGFFAYIIIREIKKRGRVQEPIPGEGHIRKDSAKFIIGAVGVIIAARFAIIPSGIAIARFMGVPEIVVGISIIAVGTSLPELVTALVASAKKMGELAAGNVIGANILNILWVLGCSSLVKALPIDVQTKAVTLPVVFLMTALLLIFSRTRSRLTRREGLCLFTLYAGYLFYILKFAYK